MLTAGQRCETSTVQWEYSVSNRFKSYVMLNFLVFPLKKKEILTTYFIYPNIVTILSFQCIINAKVIVRYIIYFFALSFQNLVCILNL